MRQRDVLDGDEPPDADDDGDEADVGDDDEGRPKTMRDDMAAAAERVARPAAAPALHARDDETGVASSRQRRWADRGT